MSPISSAMVKGKSTKGKQKIEIKPIQNAEARQVCFSKGCPSLFKMASELSTLCGVEVVVVIFSPGGHPSACSIVDRFLAVRTLHDHAMDSRSHGKDGVIDTIHEMNQQLVDLQQSMEAEKRRKENIKQAMEKESGGRVMEWLNAEVSPLWLDELEEFRKELTVLNSMVMGKLYKMLQEARQTRRPLPQSQKHMVLPSQDLCGGQRSSPMHTTLPTSSNGP